MFPEIVPKILPKILPKIVIVFQESTLDLP